MNCPPVSGMRRRPAGNQMIDIHEAFRRDMQQGFVKTVLDYNA